MADRRPAGWNQWAEVVGRDPREIRFIGDMPHAWVASDFVRSALDMFAWERRDDSALVLGAGLSGWLTGEGSAISGLATPYGKLDFAMRGNAQRLSATISGSARPPGGFVLAWPFRNSAPRAHQWPARDMAQQRAAHPRQAGSDCNRDRPVIAALMAFAARQRRSKASTPSPQSQRRLCLPTPHPQRLVANRHPLAADDLPPRLGRAR